ncbi:MAG: ISAs1 family transposase [Thermomicrobia bacterium]|nr:ISAs1 family transposase [Thermomicrobia bacterium]
MQEIVPPLAAVLTDFPDFRDPRGVRHPLLAVLLLSCVAMLCGARGESAIAEWAENYGATWRAPLGFTRPDGPSQSTVQRIFGGIDRDALEARLAQWAARVIAARPAPADLPLPFEAMAIDGKTLRGSAKCGAADAHLLSAFSQRLGVVLGQVAVPDKTNEITAIDELLARLVLTGWVVTTDALFTQTEIARAISDAGGDYLMEVKGNQPTLHDDLTSLFADPDAACAQAEETRLHGGRIERRVLRASTELTGHTDWPGMAQALCVERRVTHKATGETHTERAYAVTSLAPAIATPAQLLVLWREHWHIENKLHWIRDVTFDEDRSTVRAGNIPQVMAALRGTAISVARLHGATNIAAACRRYAAQPALALTAIGLTLDFE